MSASSTITRALTQSPLIAVTLYVAVVGGLVVATAERKCERQHDGRADEWHGVHGL